MSTVTPGFTTTVSGNNQQVTPNPVLTGEVDVNGNLIISGLGRTISGNFSDSTVKNRLHFQTTVPNSGTFVGVFPSGTAQTCSFYMDNNSTAVDSSGLAMAITDTLARVQSFARGSGSVLPFEIQTANTRALRVEANTASVSIGPAGALTTTATDGFLYVPTCAGVPTGVPTTITGKSPIVVDTTNNRLYFYSGGSWVAAN